MEDSAAEQNQRKMDAGIGLGHRLLTVVAVVLIVGGLAASLNAWLYPVWQENVYPFARDKKAIAQGAKLYQRECVGCHGANGEFSTRHHPISVHIGMHNPPNYFEVVTKGESKFAMPAFENSLTEEERWKIVSYLFDRFKNKTRTMSMTSGSK
ncbi:MAG: c-type cytochrome [Actinomycetota bacterium]|nr:c-type cytochrome [Actinomycetota bacterium]